MPQVYCGGNGELKRSTLVSRRKKNRGGKGKGEIESSANLARINVGKRGKTNISEPRKEEKKIRGKREERPSFSKRAAQVEPAHSRFLRGGR